MKLQKVASCTASAPSHRVTGTSRSVVTAGYEKNLSNVPYLQQQWGCSNRRAAATVGLQQQWPSTTVELQQQQQWSCCNNRGAEATTDLQQHWSYNSSGAATTTDLQQQQSCNNSGPAATMEVRQQRSCNNSGAAATVEL